MKTVNNPTSRYDIVERYCPKCNENVIFQRIHGLNTTYKCTNFEKCKEKKCDFSADGKIM
jgi:ssDNA-binding Zn-finger/Zn-ribbon topoisomerase 1